MRVVLQAGVFATGFVTMCANAYADSIDVAAQRYRVNADLLRAIAYYESGLNPDAVHHNENGSTDIGLMQINTVHMAELREYGIDQEHLKNASINAAVGAALLRRQMDQYGATWTAVGAYHSRTPSLCDKYARAVRDIYLKRSWQKKAARSEPPAMSIGVRVEEISSQ